MIELRCGSWTAVISEHGATLVSLSHAGRELLAHPDAVTPEAGHHGAVLAPWPGRVVGAAYRFQGREHRLEITEPAYEHAIHGFVYDVTWSVIRQDSKSVDLSVVLGEEPGYPFRVEVVVSYELTSTGMACRTSWRNVGDTTAPFGLGHHPYFALGCPVDDMWLQIDAGISVDSEPATKRPLPPRGTDVRDFRERRRIGDASFSRGYGELARKDGWAAATITRADGMGLRISVNAGYPWIQVFTADLPRVDLSRQGLAIEPQTCPPGAFGSGQDLLALAPGDGGSGEWTVELMGR